MAGCKLLDQHCYTVTPCWFRVSSKEGDILTKLCQDPFPDDGNWDYRGRLCKSCWSQAEGISSSCYLSG